MFEIREDDLRDEQSRALLELHLHEMHANSPPGSVFALDISGLTRPEVTVWSVWDNERIVAIGALRMLGDDHAEIKSMRTHPDYLRRGAAALLLDHVIGIARARGVHRLSLETGSGPPFDAALQLYRERGFESGDAFSDYEKSEFNQFLHKELALLPTMPTLPKGRPHRHATDQGQTVAISRLS